MRTATNSTRNAINALHARYSFPAIARQLKLDRTYWPVLSRIANGGSVSREVENDVRQALGLPLIERKRFYRPCLSVELGEAIRAAGVDAEEALWLFVKWTNEMNAAEAKRGMVGYEELSQEFEL